MSKIVSHILSWWICWQTVYLHIQQWQHNIIINLELCYKAFGECKFNIGFLVWYLVSSNSWERDLAPQLLNVPICQSVIAGSVHQVFSGNNPERQTVGSHILSHSQAERTAKDWLRCFADFLQHANNWITGKELSTQWNYKVCMAGKKIFLNIIRFKNNTTFKWVFCLMP